MFKVISSVLLIMIPISVFGYLGKPVEMGISLFAGFTCAVIINLDRFSSFRAGELEANIRHAEEVISEAHATIEHLKSMTEPLMNYLLAHIVRGDRIMGVNASDKELLYLRLKRNSEQFELNSDYNQELLEEAKHKIIQTYLFEVEIEAERLIESWELAQPIRDFIYQYDYKQHVYPPVSNLRTIFTKNPSLYSDTVEKCIKEYERVLLEYAISTEP